MDAAGSSRTATPVKRWRVTPASGHRSTVSYRTAAWHPWRTVAGDAQVAAGGAPIRLSTPAGSVQYRGTLRSVSVPHTARARDTVNILPLDSYLRGVVPREVPALWPAAAVRAQAVAARTYAAYERAHRSGRFDLYDTTKSQVYGGYTAEHPAPTPPSGSPRNASCCPGGAGIHAVLGQQRRVQRRRRLSLPAGRQGHLRQVRPGR